MEFYPTKCEHLQIANKHNFIDTHYTLYGHTIQKVTNANYIGITFDFHLNWKGHINIANSCMLKSMLLKHFYKEILATFCPTRWRNTFVRSIMEYSATAWSPHTVHDIINLRRFSAELLNISSMTTHLFMVFLLCLTN